MPTWRLGNTSTKQTQLVAHYCLQAVEEAACDPSNPDAADVEATADLPSLCSHEHWFNIITYSIDMFTCKKHIDY